MWSQDASLSLFLALLVGLVFFLLPLTNYQDAAMLGANLLAALLLVSGSVAVIRCAWARRLVILLALSMLVASLTRTVAHAYAIEVAGALLTALVLALLMLLLLADVYRPGPITRFRISGAVAAYVLLGLTWTYVYTLVELVAPGALHFPESDQVTPTHLPAALVYFSLATLTTVGYGDIVAVAPLARSMAMLEAICGQLFLATMIARLVSLRQPSPTRRTSEAAPSE
jgi:hypothetical protein